MLIILYTARNNPFKGLTILKLTHSLQMGEKSTMQEFIFKNYTSIMSIKKQDSTSVKINKLFANYH